ncbi:three-Cys-motif partner protein TcmP [Alcanivoracaceae bacterium MT1]
MPSKNKYQWTLGGNLPDLDEHSQAKHRIIAEYIQRYVEVYMSNTSIERFPLSIVDGFCGGGKYRSVLSNEEVDGSPFVIMNAVDDVEREINKDRRKPRSIDACYYFVDHAKQHTDFLREEIRKTRYGVKLGESIHVINDVFAKAAPAIVDRIGLRNRAQRCLFILDQYAYKDVPFNTVNYILKKLKGSEIILTFNVNSVLNYISDRKESRRALENIGLASHIDWKRLAALKEAGQGQRAVQEQLASAIYNASGARHITLFFITPKGGLTYWLVHLSKVYRARDVMMGLHWKHSNSSFSHHLSEGMFSLGYRATKTPGQAELDLACEFDFGLDAEQRCIDRLTEDIPRYIYGCKEPMEIRKLLDAIGSNTPAAESQIRKALTNVVKSKEILIATPSGKYRRSAKQAKDEDIISYCQQPIRFV